MKTEFSTRRSFQARYFDARNAARNIHVVLHETSHGDFSGDDMKKVREETERLVQAVHEMNAYRNVLLTE